MPRPRDPDIDRAVVDACVALLDEVGRAGLTRAAVARRAGVSLPAVNRRFDDVDDILLAVASTPGHVDEQDAAEDLRAFLVRTLRRMARTFAAGGVRRPAAELLAASAGDERIEKAFGAALADVRATGTALVLQAQAEGAVAADVTPDLLLDLAIGAPYYRLLWRGEAIAVADVEPLVDTVLRGCAPPPGRTPGGG
ncbi:TetR/AcrR family transcriptional regulator C-terminal ligand-binding domain-containing protein [Actinomycetospora sp. OC33-EN08]|uniref:TetR/AcrR family transcriptional regulator C-terminal ligand-binding domain-containing protein n=1 Tax=Actinomycetospora aurantiaca TaxID=3129233 RepID=A0ABU8MPN5_9PSEU